jgi:nucleoside-diphosphate-sugar epimerase
MENWVGMRPAIENGSINLPLSPSTRLQMIAVDDIGGIVAAAFERPGKWQDRAFDLAGDELSMSDIAAVFSRATGHEVRYVQTPWDEFESKAGKEMAIMFRWFEEVGYHVDISAVRQEYSKLTTFDRWMNSRWHTATRTA